MAGNIFKAMVIITLLFVIETALSEEKINSIRLEIGPMNKKNDCRSVETMREYVINDIVHSVQHDIFHNDDGSKDEIIFRLVSNETGVYKNNTIISETKDGSKTTDRLVSKSEHNQPTEIIVDSITYPNGTTVDRRVNNL